MYKDPQCCRSQALKNRGALCQQAPQISALGEPIRADMLCKQEWLHLLRKTAGGWGMPWSLWHCPYYASGNHSYRLGSACSGVSGSVGSTSESAGRAPCPRCPRTACGQGTAQSFLLRLESRLINDRADRK